MTVDAERAGDLVFAIGYGVALLALLCYLWRRRAGAPARSPLVGPAMAATASLALLGLAEGVMRQAGVPRYRGLALVSLPLDLRLGWRGYSREGDLAARRPRALVVGDSFTDAPGVGEEERYYSRLWRELGFEVWVESASGWGTLQEYLALEGVFDRVRPELVVLQVCSNDFVNNDWGLERASVVNNNRSRRPYWEDGRVVWRQPIVLGDLRRELAARSALLGWLDYRLHRVAIRAFAQGWLDGAERHVHSDGRAYAPFDRSVRTTEELVARIAQRVQARVVVILPVDTFQPFYDEWRGIAKRLALPFLDDGVTRVQAARRRGVAVHAADGAHWTSAGHHEVGQALADWVRRRPDLAPRADPRAGSSAVAPRRRAPRSPRHPCGPPSRS